jgi:hypothetical protein
VFENRVLRGIFGPKREEVVGGWRRLYASPHIIRVIKVKEVEMDRACSTHWGMRNEYKILVGKPDGKRPLRRPRHRWEHSIRMDLRELG